MTVQYQSKRWKYGGGVVIFTTNLISLVFFNLEPCINLKMFDFPVGKYLLKVNSKENATSISVNLMHLLLPLNIYLPIDNKTFTIRLQS